MDPRHLRKTGITLVAVALTGAALATSATADHVPGATPAKPGHVARLVFPIMNPGRYLSPRQGVRSLPQSRHCVRSG